ncbi:hypothetical protein [Aurantimonas sp. VKM B-3413]|uniref:hypothetical protein n=1 Tax=Aurantimonas sp. VKM B-3413 TaxID=2779401 RepID=UPI001E52A356|nr:hypothetical protein [Aurantimonas sp. VKM B-3413]MCB8837371.1 hypothetical protein [Aurantimonas sp. VKM B-3413]
MTTSSRWIGAATLALAAAGLAGCGVKSYPVASTTGKTPQVIAEPTVSGNVVVAGSGSSDTAAALRPGQISSVDSDSTISAAEVSRNQGAGKHFILDPLLN